MQNGTNTLTGSTTSTTVTNPGGTTITTPGGTTGTGTGNGLTFENDPKQTLTIHKYIEGTKNEPLAGVTFKLVDGAGTPVGPGDDTFVTDSKGEIVVEGLEPGTTITEQEVKTVEGYVLDGTPKSVKIKAGEGAPTLTFWNAKAGELVIRKLDSVTKEPLAGVEFELTYAGGGYVDNADGHLSNNGLYTTDSHGEIHISGVTGTIVVKETRTIDGYTIDESTRTQTVKVNPQDTQTLTFYNNPNRYLTVERRSEIDALSCYVSYRVQRDLYDLCRENGWFRDLPWAEFVLLMRANKPARNAAICVIFDTLSNFFVNEHFNFDAASVSMIYGGEREDPNDDNISCAQLFSPDEGHAFIESFLFLTEITHYKRQLSQGKNCSWQQFLNQLEQDRTLWDEVLMGYRDALARLNFKPAWEARRLEELIKAVKEARDDHR